jgi:hypothetical protein
VLIDSNSPIMFAGMALMMLVMMGGMLVSGWTIFRRHRRHDPNPSGPPTGRKATAGRLNAKAVAGVVEAGRPPPDTGVAKPSTPAKRARGEPHAGSRSLRDSPRAQEESDYGQRPRGLRCAPRLAQPFRSRVRSAPAAIHKAASTALRGHRPSLSCSSRKPKLTPARSASRSPRPFAISRSSATAASTSSGSRLA